MKRKVVKMGPATLVVSLPASWTKLNRIRKGAEINIAEQGNSLYINAEKNFSLTTASLNISKLEPLTFRTLGILYKVGYNELVLRYEEGAKRYRRRRFHELELIKKAIDSYTGMDIKEIKNSKKGPYIVAVERAFVSPTEFDNTLNQAFLHLKFMSEETFAYIKKKDNDKLDSIILIDDLINQTTNFCLRVLNKKGYKDYQKLPFIYSIVEGVEQVGDEYREMYEHYSAKSPKLSKETLALHTRVNEFVDGFYRAFKKFNLDEFCRLADKGQELFEEFEYFFENCKKDDMKILFHLNTVTKKVYDLFEPLMALNHEGVVENW